MSALVRPPVPVTRSQKLATLVGCLLILIGALGFIGGSDFGAGSDIHAGRFLGFAVNGWTNVAHIALGLVLLLVAPVRPLTRAVWRLTAIVYLVVVLYGLIDGDDVFSLFPLNTPAKIFDIVMFLIAFTGARWAKDLRSFNQRDRVVVPESAEPPVVGPGSGHIGGPRRFAARIDSKL